MRGDISHRGRKGNFLPGEKEESWKTAIREKEAAKQKHKDVAIAPKTCATCAHVGYRQGKFGYMSLCERRYLRHERPETD
jgi:hypothetical protein